MDGEIFNVKLFSQQSIQDQDTPVGYFYSHLAVGESGAGLSCLSEISIQHDRVGAHLHTFLKPWDIGAAKISAFQSEAELKAAKLLGPFT